MSQGDNLNEPPDRGPMDQFSAHIDRGWDLVNRGDLAGAQRSAENSVELDGDSPEAHNLLGYVYAAQGDADSALEHYRQAIALDDSFVEAMLNAAEVLIHPVHDFDSAISLVDEALEWTEGADEVADALLLKFDAHMHRADNKAARAVLATLPEGPYATARLHFLVGRAFFEVTDHAAAREHLERAIESEPEAADAHYYLGLLLDAGNEQAKATLSFLRCRELDSATPRPAWSPTQGQFERALRRAIDKLEGAQRDVLDGTLIVACDLPGAEVVADGVDPRAPVMLDALSEQDGKPRAGRAFIYQRNAERMCPDPSRLDEELQRFLQTEIEAVFPQLAKEESPKDGEPEEPA